MIRVLAPNSPPLRSLLASHPGVELEPAPGPAGQITWSQGEWHRRICLDGSVQGEFGLAELMDNNPLVCADAASVPPPAAVLALAALGPIWQSGLICGEPAFDMSQDADLAPWLASIQFSESFTASARPDALDGVAALNLFVPISNPPDWSDLDTLYDEAYGGSFYVRKHDGDWTTAAAFGSPALLYSLRISPGDGESLLTVQTMCDLEFGLGAARAVHLFNIMCSFEECLGIPDQLPSRS